MHLKNLLIFIVIAALKMHAPMDANAVSYTENQASSDRVLTRDMTENDIMQLIYNAMPYPVISIWHGTQGDRRHFAINMNIAALGKSKPVFHVTFHVPISADRAVIERAVNAAARYAIRSLSQLQ